MFLLSLLYLNEFELGRGFIFDTVCFNVYGNLIKDDSNDAITTVG